MRKIKALTVTIGTKEYMNSESFESVFNCPLSVAIRTQVPKCVRTLVGGSTVTIYYKKDISIGYSIGDTWKINLKSEKKFKAMINQRIEDAKNGIEQDDVVVELLK